MKVIMKFGIVAITSLCMSGYHAVSVLSDAIGVSETKRYVRQVILNGKPYSMTLGL